MDTAGIEEMLFGLLSSQDIPNCSRNGESNDGTLKDTDDSGVDIWDEEADEFLETPPTDSYPDDVMLEDSDDYVSYQNNSIEFSHTLKDRDWVIARIESIIENIVEALLDGKNEISIILKTSSENAVKSSLNNGEYNRNQKARSIRFPGGSIQEAWRFTVLLRILELVHSCLTNNVAMTKRDIYYRQPDLFVNQAVVDRYVDDIARAFGVSRSLLNVGAAAKGLVAGNFAIRREDGTSLYGLSEKEGLLIPLVHDADVVDLSPVRWILVIEKEATFRSLLGSRSWTKLGSQGIAMTAKGYPDLASRRFLRHLVDQSPDISMFALVDFDSDGIAIMSTYKYGSRRLAHENVTSSGTPTLNLPQLCWLGVQSHQINRTPASEGDTEDGTILDVQGLMRLTPRDRRKACRMLEWGVCAEDGAELAWRRELQTMLILNVKAEMQMLEELPGGLAVWLENELEARQGLKVEG